jgi:hypothetical protein
MPPMWPPQQLVVLFVLISSSSSEVRGSKTSTYLKKIAQHYRSITPKDEPK